jgi:hypothetical protein
VPDATGATGASLLLKLLSIIVTSTSSCPASAGAAVEPGMETRAGNIQRVAKPCHRPDRTVLRDESEPHVASLAK